MQDHYLINGAKAVSQTLEGETIVINLEKGSYYSFNKTGSLLWDLVILGHSLEHIAQYFSDAYALQIEESRDMVRDFVSSIKQEDLIVSTDEAPASPMPQIEKSEGTFIRPSFERYDDMQEMLLADPIHDVGEAGWPVLKKEIV